MSMRSQKFDKTDPEVAQHDLPIDVKPYIVKVVLQSKTKTKQTCCAIF